MLADWYHTSPDLAAAGLDTAVICIASIEQHGPHLPLGTDYIIGQAIAAEVARQIGAYQVPTFAVGTCQEHMGRAGSVWIKPETLYRVVGDVCLSLGEQGFQKIVVLLSHGGLWMVKPAVREINLNNPGLTVIWTHTYDHVASEVQILEGTGLDLHAGEGETSLILHLAPESVRMERAVDFVPEVGREFLDYVPTARVCPDGVWGRATLGTAEKGRRLFEAMVRGLVDYCQDTFERLEELKGAGGE